MAKLISISNMKKFRKGCSLINGTVHDSSFSNIPTIACSTKTVFLNFMLNDLDLGQREKHFDLMKNVKSVNTIKTLEHGNCMIFKSKKPGKISVCQDGKVDVIVGDE